MSIDALVRPEIRSLHPYATARQENATVRLNANELSWSSNGVAGGRSLNRYPAIRPTELNERLADNYGVPSQNLLVTRGSSEAIDLLVRAFCRAGRDSIVVMEPTFGMYRVYGDIQGATTLPVPLDPDRDFELDVAATLARCTPDTKLIFLCSPNNPTGNALRRADITDIARARAERSIVVVDEAYAEFSAAPSLVDSLGELENLVVLRTLSKALGLAGVRCGALIGPAKLVGWLNGILAPYALATPVVESVLAAFSPPALAGARQAVAAVVSERERLHRELTALPAVAHVWASNTNFLLVRLRRFDATMAALRAKRILVRDFAADRALVDCVRITIGCREENDLLLGALRDGSEA